MCHFGSYAVPGDNGEEGDGGVTWKTGESGARGKIWGVGNKLITHFIKRTSDEKHRALEDSMKTTAGSNISEA